MQYKISKFSLNFIFASILLLSSLPTFAITYNSEQLIHIESDTQSLDIQNNLLTFTGHVIITYDTIKITADKVIVTRPDDKYGKEIIDGYGNQAAFYQIQNNGKLVKGHSLHMHYELANNVVILTGNAYLEQLGSNINSDKIIYLIKERKMRACSEKNKHVTAILIPSQLQDKNRK